jgi:hypothetical protein
MSVIETLKEEYVEARLAVPEMPVDTALSDLALADTETYRRIFPEIQKLLRFYHNTGYAAGLQRAYAIMKEGQ